MRVSVAERIVLEDRPYKFGVTFEQFVKHLTVVDVVATTIP